MIRTLAFALILFAHGLVDALAQSAKPRVPPNWDRGGTLVALIGAGIDYRQPAIAVSLARDGEGELIGWDCIENDRLPFDRLQGTSPAAAGGDGTAIAHMLLTAGVPVRLVPIRADVANARSLGDAAIFAGKTGARVVIVPMWSDNGGVWEAFRLAVAINSHVLFIVAAGEGPDPAALYPAAFNLSNMMVVSAGEGRREAKGFNDGVRPLTDGILGAASAARIAARILASDPKIDIPTLKARIETESAAK
ncbi:MAG: hypothetical protein EKK41_27005 [Hyphomicrobiales bacterium]|nr:MAG: hypothetical protein EKK41_27005 [Hyphomicrobiales bacterium]